MKIILKTDAYGFYAEIFNPLIARALKGCLPLESRITESDDKICFRMNKIDLALQDSSLQADNGDVIWSYSDNYLCICLGLNTATSDNTFIKGIKVGYTLTSVEELRQLKQNDKISISLSDELKAPDNKILSQNEIDDLVKGLLSEKDNGAHPG